MPVTLVQHISDNLFFGVWEIDETISELESRWLFTQAEKEIYAGFRTDSRRQQWLSYRLLLKTLLEDDHLVIIYDHAGKPYLEEHSYHISVTHTLKYAAAAICKTGRVGIDMEAEGRNLTRISSKYCSDEELAEINNPSDLFRLTLYWCAKEALYKLYGLKQLDFRQHIRISALDPFSSNRFTGTIHLPSDPCNPCNPSHPSYPLQYFIFKNLIIVTAMEKY